MESAQSVFRHSLSELLGFKTIGGIYMESGFGSLRVWRIVAKISAVLCALLGLIALTGWGFSLPLFTTFGTDRIPMAPSTAILFLLFGSLALLRTESEVGRGSTGTTRILTGIGIALAFALLVASLLGIQSNLEHLGFSLGGMVGGAPVGHMSPLTASCFMLAGLAQYFLPLNASGEDYRYTTAFWISTLLMLISIALVAAYLLGAPLLYNSGMIPPALTTSLAFLLLAIAILVPSAQHLHHREQVRDNSSVGGGSILVLVFVVISAVLLAMAYFYFSIYASHFRAETGKDLAAIADLKINELVQWRKERMSDGIVFFHNREFTYLVERFLAAPDDELAAGRVREWLKHVLDAYQYDRLALLSADGRELLTVPGMPDTTDPHMAERAVEILENGQVCFLDLHRHESDGKIYMSVAIPILSTVGDPDPLGTIAAPH